MKFSPGHQLFLISGFFYEAGTTAYLGVHDRIHDIDFLSANQGVTPLLPHHP